MAVEDAIDKRLSNDACCDTRFVRRTMEEVSDAYNRYTIAMRGLQTCGIAWFANKTSFGPVAPTLVRPYETLSFDAKEIDRRMVIMGLSKFAKLLPNDTALQLPQADAKAILKTVEECTPHNYLAGYAVEASYD